MVQPHLQTFLPPAERALIGDVIKNRPAVSVPSEQVETQNTGNGQILSTAVGVTVSAGLDSVPVKPAEKQPLYGSAGLYEIIALQKKEGQEFQGDLYTLVKAPLW